MVPDHEWRRIDLEHVSDAWTGEQHPSWRQPKHDANAKAGVEQHDVDRSAHAEGVDRPGCKEEGSAGRRADEPAHALARAFGHIDLEAHRPVRHDRSPHRPDLTSGLGHVRPQRSAGTSEVVRRLLGIVLCGAAVACVAPARTSAAYEGKAVSTAETALSAVAAARLAARLAADGGAFGPYVATTIADAESDVRSAHGLFDSVQPPDAVSERLRVELDGILTQATNEITALRIRARWTDFTALANAGGALSDLTHRLEAFLRRYG